VKRCEPIKRKYSLTRREYCIITRARVKRTLYPPFSAFACHESFSHNRITRPENIYYIRDIRGIVGRHDKDNDIYNIVRYIRYMYHIIVIVHDTSIAIAPRYFPRCCPLLLLVFLVYFDFSPQTGSGSSRIGRKERRSPSRLGH